ncbi:MAG: cytochrome C [Deltaproteobacteria bacterium]|jgi:mono/diheme cytochrome c family protein
MKLTTPLYSLSCAFALIMTACVGSSEQPATNHHVPTADKLVRGEYLAHSVAICVDCHSDRDFSRFAGPPVRGTAGKGGAPFTREMGIPGTVFARNITPAALGTFSDEQILRAMTAGVGPRGDALFPLMPYLQLRKMCRSDLEAILAWLRALEPIDFTVPPRALDIPWDAPAGPTGTFALREDCPDRKDTIAYGQYLLESASCHDCHTVQDANGPVPGRMLAGGFDFDVSVLGMHVTSANITPDVDTGIGAWSRERFIGRFKAFADADSLPKLDPGDGQTIMPWTSYAGMSEEDLGAIYDYLRTVPPVKNAVTRFRDGPGDQTAALTAGSTD